MIDLEQIALHIDCERLLVDGLGMKYIRKIGKEYRIECPNPLHVDKHPSCSLSTEKLIYHCFGCDAKGTIIDLISILKDMKRDRAEDYLLEFAGLGNDNMVAEIVHNREYERKINNYKLSYNYSLDWSNADKCIMEFVTRRKFDLQLFKKYYIGYNNSLRSITIPIIHGKSIVNIGERFIFPIDPSIKIMYKKGSSLDDCIWGLMDDYSKDEPYFTEGVFDAIRMRQAGYNAFAVLNNQLSEKKISLILEWFGLDLIRIVPDNDNGGKMMIDNWKKMLNYTDVNVVEVKEYKDVDEMPLNEIPQMVDKQRDLKDIVCPNPEKEEFVCVNLNELR